MQCTCYKHAQQLFYHNTSPENAVTSAAPARLAKPLTCAWKPTCRATKQTIVHAPQRPGRLQKSRNGTSILRQLILHAGRGQHRARGPPRRCRHRRRLLLGLAEGPAAAPLVAPDIKSRGGAAPRSAAYPAVECVCMGGKARRSLVSHRRCRRPCLVSGQALKKFEGSAATAGGGSSGGGGETPHWL